MKKISITALATVFFFACQAPQVQEADTIEQPGESMIDPGSLFEQEGVYETENFTVSEELINTPGLLFDACLGLIAYEKKNFFAPMLERLTIWTKNEHLLEDGYNSDACYSSRLNRMIIYYEEHENLFAIFEYDIDSGQMMGVFQETEDNSSLPGVSFGLRQGAVIPIQGKTCRNMLHGVKDIELMGEEAFLEEARCIENHATYNLLTKEISPRETSYFQPSSMEEFNALFEMN